MDKYNIYLIRHGESALNAHSLEKSLPDHAIPLTEKGINQAKEAGKFLATLVKQGKIDVLDTVMWVSPYFRTRQTAENILSNINIPTTNIKEDDMLVELQFGLFNNIPKSERATKLPKEWEAYTLDREHNGKFFARMPNGESPFDCTIRQKLFIDTLFRDINNKGKKNIIIVGHGAAITCFRKAFFHYSYEWYAKEPNPMNCSIQHIVIEPGVRNYDLGYIFKGPIIK